MRFPGGGTHITRDTCFPGRGTHITRHMHFPGGGTHITRDTSAPVPAYFDNPVHVGRYVWECCQRQVVRRLQKKLLVPELLS